MGLTKAELDFYEAMPIMLADIRNNIAEQNKLLKDILGCLQGQKSENE